MDIQKIRHWAICLFLFLCPIMYNTTPLMDLRETQERGFQILAMCLFAFFVGNVWIGAFIILNVFSLLLNDWTVGLSQILNVFLGSVIFLVSRSYFKKNEIKPYLNVILWVAVINILWMAMQHNGIDPLYIAQNASGTIMTDITFRDFSGLFGIKMANGIFLSIITPIIASLNIFLVPFIIIPVYFCRASIVGLAIFVSMLFYIYHIHRKLFIYFFVIGSIAGSIYAYYDMKDDPTTFKSRLPLWHMGLKYTLSRPMGYGPDSWRNYNKQKDFLFYSDYDYNPAILTRMDDNKYKFKYYDMDNGKMHDMNNGKLKNCQLNWWDNAHNEYVQLMFEYGFLGLLLLGGLIREMYYRFKFAIRSKELIVITSCLIVYFVTSLGHFPLHLARLAFLFPLLLGAFYAKTESSLT